MTQPGTGWRPTALGDVEVAIKNGLIEEDHFLDLKRDLKSGSSANKDIAKDLAAFSIDGGLVLIGVDEGPPVSINPIPLDGLAERVEQIGLMAVNEPIVVNALPLRDVNDPSLGVLAIEIPPSPRAPHMADGRYYARGNKTNIVLSDAEVVRYHERRFKGRSDLAAETLVLVENLSPGHESLLAVVAEPLSAMDDLFEDLSAHENWQTEIRGLVAGVATSNQSNYAPSVAVSSVAERRANGVALTTGQVVGSGSMRGAEIAFEESGRIVLVSERATEMRKFSAVNPQPPDLRIVFERLIAGNVELMLRLAAQAGKDYGYRGSWRFAVVVTGLKGATSATLAEPWGDQEHVYTNETYSRAVEASLAELEESATKILGRLVLSLFRALGVHAHSDWKYLST